MPQLAIPYAQIRGGSSKGLYFKASDLPATTFLRDQALLAAMGMDERQIDGLGGADPLTSKVAIVSLSERPGVDIDYLFAQVLMGKNSVDISPNCGNILAGVGVFAIETGLITPKSDETRIVVHMVNSDRQCELTLQTPNKQLTYSGSTIINGVPGASAPIVCNYRNLSGSACGALLPTGKSKDTINGIEVTCIDNGMPVAVLSAESVGMTGYESPEELNQNIELKHHLYELRLAVGKIMNLGDVSEKAVPKMCMVSSAMKGGSISTRTFIPDQCHPTIGVLGAVSIATACILEGSVCHKIAKVVKGDAVEVSIEHPSGELTVKLETTNNEGSISIDKAGVIRTARLLSRGELFIPEASNYKQSG